MPFSGNPLDRSSNQRKDEAWIASRAAAATNRYLPFWRLHVLTRESEALTLHWCDAAVHAHLEDGAAPYLLGVLDGVAHYAVDVSSLDDPVAAMGLDGAAFVECRSVTLRLPPHEAGIMAHGRALIDWHRRHRFCGSCGSPTLPREAGASRQCESCGAHVFPRTDPVVIMVVWHGEKALLGRRSGRLGTFFSALAGFVDQGETIEEAVRREVKEEVGLDVDEVMYHSSQPWPFPSNLMIGCFAHATGTDVQVDDEEIAEARWFTRAELLQATTSPGPNLDFAVPDRIAIAHHLIRAWAEGHAHVGA